MARRKKSTRRRKTGRRRMGAMAKGTFTQALGIIAGAIAGKMVAKALPIGDDRIKNGVVAVAGVFLPSLVKGDFVKAIGNGMIAVGGAGLVGSVVPALGAMTEDTMDFPVTVGEIPDNLSVIAGDNSVMAGDNLSVLAGYDEDDMY